MSAGMEAEVSASQHPSQRRRSGSISSQPSWYFRSPPLDPTGAPPLPTHGSDVAVNVSLPKHSRMASVATTANQMESHRYPYGEQDENADDVGELIRIKLPTSRAASVVNGWNGSGSQYGGARSTISRRSSYYAGSVAASEMQRAQEDYYRQYYEYYYGPQGMYPEGSAYGSGYSQYGSGYYGNASLTTGSVRGGDAPRPGADSASVYSRYEEAYRGDDAAMEEYAKDYHRWYQEQYWNYMYPDWNGDGRHESGYDWARGDASNAYAPYGYDPSWYAPQGYAGYGESHHYGGNEAMPSVDQTQEATQATPKLADASLKPGAGLTTMEEPPMRDVSAVNTPRGGSPSVQQWRETSAAAMKEKELVEDGERDMELDKAGHYRRASSTFGARTPQAAGTPLVLPDIDIDPSSALKERVRANSATRKWAAHELGPPVPQVPTSTPSGVGLGLYSSPPSQVTSNLFPASVQQREATAEADRLLRKATQERQELEAAAAEQVRIMSQMDQLRDKIAALERDRAEEARRAQEAEKARKRIEEESKRIMEQEAERRQREEQERMIRAEVERRLKQREQEETEKRRKEELAKKKEEEKRHKERETKEAEERRKREQEEQYRRRLAEEAEAKRAELEEVLRQTKLAEEARKIELERARILAEAEEAKRRAREAELAAERIREAAERERRLLEELERQRKESEERERQRLREEEQRRLAEIEELKRRQLAEFELRRKRDEEQTEAKLKQLEDELKKREQELVEREAARRRAREPDMRVWKTSREEWMTPDLSKSDGSHIPPPPMEGPPKSSVSRRSKSVAIRPGELAEWGIEPFRGDRSAAMAKIRDDGEMRDAKSDDNKDGTSAPSAEEPTSKSKRARNRRGKSISNADIMRAPSHENEEPAEEDTAASGHQRQDSLTTRNTLANAATDAVKPTAAEMKEVAAQNRSRRDKRKSRSGMTINTTGAQDVDGGVPPTPSRVKFADEVLTPKPVYTNGVPKKEEDTKVKPAEDSNTLKPPRKAPKPLVEMNIETKKHGRQRLVVRVGDDPRKAAAEFCQKYDMLEVKEGLSQLVIKAAEKRSTKKSDPTAS